MPVLSGGDLYFSRIPLQRGMALRDSAVELSPGCQTRLLVGKKTEAMEKKNQPVRGLSLVGARTGQDAGCVPPASFSDSSLRNVLPGSTDFSQLARLWDLGLRAPCLASFLTLSAIVFIECELGSGHPDTWGGTLRLGYSGARWPLLRGQLVKR